MEGGQKVTAQGGRGHRAVLYTSHQSFNQRFWGLLLNFDL